MKNSLVVGYKGKLGSLLIQRGGFVALDCDVTDIESIYNEAYRLLGEEWEAGTVVNCAAISSIDECEKDYKKAIEVNANGLKNLHRVFGSNVLNISSDQIFSGRDWKLPTEETDPKPINNYGLTKFVSEGISSAFDGKTIRLSRTVSLFDADINQYMESLLHDNKIDVPDFFSRNYIHREHAVDGIECMVRNWDSMPKLVNYAGTENVTMYSFVKMLAMDLGFRPQDVLKRSKYDDTMVPRPRNGGLNVSLAKSLGFPMYNISDTVGKLVDEYDN